MFRVWLSLRACSPERMFSTWAYVQWVFQQEMGTTERMFPVAHLAPCAGHH